MSWLSKALKRNKKHTKGLQSILGAIPIIGPGASMALGSAMNNLDKNKKKKRPKKLVRKNYIHVKERFRFSD
jgi:hypothetical protein